MKINVRCSSLMFPYRGVDVSIDNMTYDLGLLDEKERKELASYLREAAYELDDGEQKDYYQPGLEKALEIVKDYLSDLKDDKKFNEALWVDVVREHLETELED